MDIAMRGTASKQMYEGLKLTYISLWLNKKNYVNWSVKTEVLCIIQGVWPIVSGSEKEPNKRIDLEGTQDWKIWNNIGLAILGGSIDETEYRAIRSICKVSEAWAKLWDIHRPNGEQAFYCHMNGIMKLHAEGSTSIQEAS